MLKKKAKILVIGTNYITKVTQALESQPWSKPTPRKDISSPVITT